MNTIELANKCEALESVGNYTFTIEQLEAFRQACVKEAMQWQPIETSPKDGTRILLYRPLADRTQDFKVEIMRGIPRDSGCWAETIPKGMDATNYTDGYCKATQWMPLPAAPEVK